MPRKKKEVVPEEKIEEVKQEIPDSGMVTCRICGREFSKRSHAIVQASVHITISDRVIDLRDGVVCKECLTQLPNFLAGALHLAFNVPKDAFHRKFMYPPFSFMLDKPELKKRKKSVPVQHIVVEPESPECTSNKFTPTSPSTTTTTKMQDSVPIKARRRRRTIDDKVEAYMAAKKEAKKAIRRQKNQSAEA